MTLTTDQAAAVLGLRSATVRRWVMKGWLVPLARNTRPLRFHAADVERARARRLSEREHDEIDTLWARVLDTG